MWCDAHVVCELPCIYMSRGMGGICVENPRIFEFRASRDTAVTHTCNTSHVTRHTSHATRHSSHVTRHVVNVTRHSSSARIPLPCRSNSLTRTPLKRRLRVCACPSQENSCAKLASNATMRSSALQQQSRRAVCCLLFEACGVVLCSLWFVVCCMLFVVCGLRLRVFKLLAHLLQSVLPVAM